MGKVKVGLISLIANNLTKVLEKCFLCSPLPNMNFAQAADLDWLPWQRKKKCKKKKLFPQSP